MSTDSDKADLLPVQQQANAWLIRLRTNELTEAETRDFAEWLSHDPSHAHAFGNAEDLFNLMAQAARVETLAFSSKPNALPGQDLAGILVKHRPGLGRISRWLAAPLALAAAWLFAVNLVQPEQASLWDAYFSDYHTGTGEQRTVKLADGSNMLLNTNTAVSVSYQDKARNIILHHGQAQFNVTTDKTRPFTVRAGDLEVRALGTVFEVYRKAMDDIDVSVQEHAVVAHLDANKPHQQIPPVRINQGEQLHYLVGSGKLSLPEVANDEISGAWRQRRVILKDRPLSELVAEIERYRVGRIYLRGDQLKNLHVTGLFSLADPDAALAKVEKILGLKQTKLGPWWVLLHR